MGQATATSPGPPRQSSSRRGIRAKPGRSNRRAERLGRRYGRPLNRANVAGPRQLHLDRRGVDPTSHPKQALRFLFHDCDPQTQQWALDTLRLLNPGLAVHQHRPEPLPSAGPPCLRPCPSGTGHCDRSGCARQRASGWAPSPRSRCGTLPHVSRPDKERRNSGLDLSTFAVMPRGLPRPGG